MDEKVDKESQKSSKPPKVGYLREDSACWECRHRDIVNCGHESRRGKDSAILLVEGYDRTYWCPLAEWNLASSVSKG
jgi:hypothetical protein